MVRVSGFGQDGCFLLLCWCGLGRAVLEAEAVVSSLQDVAVMGEAIEQRRRHLGVAEDGRPFAEAEIGGDDGKTYELAGMFARRSLPSKGCFFYADWVCMTCRSRTGDPFSNMPQEGSKTEFAAETPRRWLQPAIECAGKGDPLNTICQFGMSQEMLIDAGPRARVYHSQTRAALTVALIGVVGRPIRAESCLPSSNSAPWEALTSQPAMAAASPSGRPKPFNAAA